MNAWKEIRRKRAQDRQLRRSLRTTHEQLALISTRPGNSARETERLLRQRKEEA